MKDFTEDVFKALEDFYSNRKDYRDADIILMNKKDFKSWKNFINNNQWGTIKFKKGPMYFTGIRVLRCTDLNRGEILVY